MIIGLYCTGVLINFSPELATNENSMKALLRLSPSFEKKRKKGVYFLFNGIFFWEVKTLSCTYP